MICCVPILNPDGQGCEQGHLTKIQTQKFLRRRQQQYKQRFLKLPSNYLPGVRQKTFQQSLSYSHLVLFWRYVSRQGAGGRGGRRQKDRRNNSQFPIPNSLFPIPYTLNLRILHQFFGISAFNHSCRYTNSDGIGRNIFSDYCSCTDDTTLTNGDSI